MMQLLKNRISSASSYLHEGNKAVSFQDLLVFLLEVFVESKKFKEVIGEEKMEKTKG